MLTQDDFYWDEYFWKANVSLPSVTGPNSCLGPYAPNREELQTDSEIELTAEPQGGPKAPLTESELGSVNWFLAHETEVIESAIQGLYTAYPEMRVEYDYSDDEKDEYMDDDDELDEDLDDLDEINED